MDGFVDFPLFLPSDTTWPLKRQPCDCGATDLPQGEGTLSHLCFFSNNFCITLEVTSTLDLYMFFFFPHVCLFLLSFLVLCSFWSELLTQFLLVLKSAMQIRKAWDNDSTPLEFGGKGHPKWFGVKVKMVKTSRGAHPNEESLMNCHLSSKLTTACGGMAVKATCKCQSKQTYLIHRYGLIAPSGELPTNIITESQRKRCHPIPDQRTWSGRLGVLGIGRLRIGVLGVLRDVLLRCMSRNFRNQLSPTFLRF